MKLTLQWQNQAKRWGIQDPSLKRCFGKDWNVADCNWDDIATLRSVKEPHQPVPRLKDLLEYLATPGLEDIWVLLDVKVLLPSLMQALVGDKATQKTFDDYADDLYRSIALTLADAKPSSRPWNQRIVVGCWGVSHIVVMYTFFLSKYTNGCRRNSSHFAQNISPVIL